MLSSSSSTSGKQEEEPVQSFMKLICFPFIASQSIVNVVSKGKSGMSDSSISETGIISSFSPS